jgi:hypothetical protein
MVSIVLAAWAGYAHGPWQFERGERRGRVEVGEK